MKLANRKRQVGLLKRRGGDGWAKGILFAQDSQLTGCRAEKMSLREEMHRGGEAGEMGDKLRGIGMFYFSLKRVNVSQPLLVNGEAMAGESVKLTAHCCY